MIAKPRIFSDNLRFCSWCHYAYLRLPISTSIPRNLPRPKGIELSQIEFYLDKYAEIELVTNMWRSKNSLYLCTCSESHNLRQKSPEPDVNSQVSTVHFKMHQKPEEKKNPQAGARMRTGC